MSFDANPLMLAGKIAMSYGKKQDQDQGGSGGMPVEPPYWHGQTVASIYFFLIIFWDVHICYNFAVLR
jgi:hypothetical protein